MKEITKVVILALRRWRARSPERLNTEKWSCSTEPLSYRLKLGSGSDADFFGALCFALSSLEACAQQRLDVEVDVGARQSMEAGTAPITTKSSFMIMTHTAEHLGNPHAIVSHTHMGHVLEGGRSDGI